MQLPSYRLDLLIKCVFIFRPTIDSSGSAAGTSDLEPLHGDISFTSAPVQPTPSQIKPTICVLHQPFETYTGSLNAMSKQSMEKIKVILEG